MKVIQANLVAEEDLKKITDSIDAVAMQGVDDIFREGPPCLAELSKLTKEEGEYGKPNFGGFFTIYILYDNCLKINIVLK